MKIIDIHCHTTPRSLDETVSADASLKAIKKNMEQAGIVTTNLLATYFPHNGSGISNYRMQNWIKDKSEFTMFGSLDFEHYFFQGFNELDELSEQGLIKGIKIYTCYQNIDLESDKMEFIFDLAKERELPIMFHIGYSFASQRKYGKPSVAEMVSPSQLEQLAQKYYEIPIIVSHLGKPYFKELVSLMRNNENVYTDMSGLINSRFDRAEIPWAIEGIKEVVGELGPDRLLFGTDFPVQTHCDSIYFIEEAMQNYSEEDKKKVYYDNSAKLLKLFE